MIPVVRTSMTCRAWVGLVAGLVLTIGSNAPVRAERLAIRTFTASDGLPRDQVTALLADSRGFLWLGTQEGLARFDGGQFTLFGPAEGLANAAIYDLIEDRGGRYWIATGGGVYRFTPSPREFLRVSALGSRGDAAGAGGDATTVGASRAAMVLLEDREGVIWCGSSEGLLRVRGGDTPGGLALDEVPLALDPTEHGRVVGALLEARDGTLWIGTGSGLFRRTRDGRVDRFTRADGLPDHEVWALAEDAAGDLWVGTRFGLARLDVNRSSAGAPPRVVHVYTERDGLPASNVKSLAAESDGAIRVGLTGGVVRLTAERSNKSRVGKGRQPLQSKFKPLSRGRGVWGEGALDEVIRDVRVRDMATDSAGHLWMATDRGAVRLAHGGFVTYGEEDGLQASRVRSLFEDRQGRVCATIRSDGYRVQCFDGQRFSSVDIPIAADALDTMWGWLHLTVVDRDGAWWFPTSKGLYHFPAGPIASVATRAPAAVYTHRDGLDTDHLFRLFEDSRGDLWMSTFTDTRGGLCRRSRATGRIQCFGPAEGMPAQAPTAYAFAEDRQGRVWVAFQDGYLARCDTRCTFVMRDNDTLGGVLRDLHVDHDGRLWIASASGGLARIDDPAAPTPRVERYTLADGLASQTIWAIAEDDAGRIYLAGGRGVDRLDPRTREIVNFSEADGLARGEVRAAMRAADGTLWFAAAEGLSRLSPRDDPARLVYPVRIVGLRVAGAPHAVSDAGDREIDGLRLSPHARAIEIDFVSPRFGVGRDLLYQYRLEGLDAEWQPPTRQHSVTYAHLPSGTHRFAVRAVSADGRSVSPAATVTFTVERPFWQRWWFVTLLIGLGASALAAWHRVRLARTVEIERVRTRIASDLHDEIGAGLSEIAILSEVVHQKIPSPLAPLTPLTRIASTSRELVDAMSDIVWAINPRKDSLGNLTQRMRRFATDLLTARGIAFRFDADERDEALPISADKRRQVFLIFKESLNNVVRHAECRHVAIDFRVNHDGLVLRVADDGLGLSRAHPHNGHGPRDTTGDTAGDGNSDGHGLASMHARARELGGTLTVNTEAAGGTTLTLRTPFVRGRAARLLASARARARIFASPTKVRR
jgi:ligand-binding sensor domain-containing protein/signal transduction histidine kinase